MKPVLIDQKNDITPFASTDSSRLILNGVHFAPDYTEATDGRVMIRVPYSSIDSQEFPQCPGPVELEPVTVPTDKFKKALSNRGKSKLPVLNSVKVAGDVKSVTMTATDSDVSFQATTCKGIDLTWPNTDQVWPKEEAKIEICLSSELLGKICDYAQKHGTGSRKDHATGIKFSFVDGESVVRFQIPFGDRKDAVGLLMPMRTT